jgi:prepilin-type N-terminal cleavage/methylation domain-containing protein
MKTQPSHRKSGFTLVELLVVIAIIAVLAGAGFAAGNAAIQKARKVTTLATCTAIESSVNAFFTEYGTMPTTATTDKTYSTKETEGKAIITVLLGYTETATPPLNTRAIKFLSVKDGKKTADGGTGGLITSGTAPNLSVDGLYDPWGGPFFMMLDGDYDDTLKDVKTGQTGSVAKTLNGKKVAVWSEGADAKTKKAAADDVTTW